MKPPRQRTRALSFRQATACENAISPGCQCRCGGAAHGKERVQDVMDLPANDPHRPARYPKLPTDDEAPA